MPNWRGLTAKFGNSVHCTRVTHVQNLSKLRSTFRKLCISTMLIHSQKRNLPSLQKVRGSGGNNFIRCFRNTFTCGGFTLNNDRRCLREKCKNNHFFFIITPQANALPPHKKYISSLPCFCTDIIRR